ncbi:MAG: cupin domain-containing protein [Armatimonadetes bacterium]|nr:cupin domain-containing protein [Armatimonadota bacterium]
MPAERPNTAQSILVDSEMQAIVSGSGSPISATGSSFSVYEWQGDGGGFLHVHHEDDECWHVLEGTLTFRLPGGEIQAPAGTTVFVPAGTPHDYRCSTPTDRYLIMLTPRLDELIQKLHSTPRDRWRDLYIEYKSEILEG